MVDKEGKNMDAVFIATDAPSHARLAIQALNRGYLTDDFIRAILLKRNPCVDVATALNTTVSDIYAHMSAMKGGETLKIPVYKL